MIVRIPRLQCKNCGAIKQPKLNFADPKRHYTRSLERFVADLCQVTQLDNVADISGLAWDTVKEIHKRYLQRKCQRYNLKDVRYIAIDEIYLGKKRKFVTLVMDLESGRVLYVGKGKGKAALKGFWNKIRRYKANIKAVATDMASGYMSAVLEHLPNADLVLDHFHLVKWFNDKLSLLRRQLFNKASVEDKQILKGSRWLLLKAPENLRTHRHRSKDERERLAKALEINEPLSIAYYMKERLRLLFKYPDREVADAELASWIAEAECSEIKILQAAARMLDSWKPFILNWYKHKISTGKLEATNRKIGTLQRNACGYRDEKYLKLRILNIHNSTYALTG